LRDECYTSTECNQPNYRSPSWPFGLGANRKGATAFNDVSGRWSAPWNATITLGINNLFDKKPSPLYSAKALGYNGAAGLDPGLDIDRYFYVSYQQKF
ncbi:MAG: TonB-dependent receptor, partial [Halothiobacillus sp.]|nr:TonB-dependent receptor [Halothiobacillus sp.]